MGAPRMRDRGSAYWRPMMSTEPPGGNGTTSVIGREGYLSSARAASGASADRPARPRPAPSSLRRGGGGGVTGRVFIGINANRGGQKRGGAPERERTPLKSNHQQKSYCRFFFEKKK